MTPESIPDSTGTSVVESFPQTIEVTLKLKISVDSQEMKNCYVLDNIASPGLLADIFDVLLSELQIPVNTINDQTPEQVQLELNKAVGI
jgi:hypothetical protein